VAKGKYIVTCLLVLVLGYVIVNLMNLGADGIEGTGTDFQRLALKMAIGRLVIIGGSILLAWGFISRLVAVYFRVEIGPLKYRILIWYVLAEAVLIWSVYRL